MPNLTAREIEVLTLIAKGHRGERIAGLLGVTSSTINQHRRAAMMKLNAETSAHAVALAIRAGLLKL